MSATTLPQIDYSLLQASILHVIDQQQDPCGLDIKDDLDAVYHEEVSHPRLYTNIGQLVDRGLVNKGEVDGRTNWYRVTERGKTELRALRSWFNGDLDE